MTAGWRAVRELTLADPLKAFDAWNELWLGAAAAHDRFLKVQTTRSLGERGWSITWRIAPVACGQPMAVDRLAKLGERQPACLQVLVAQHDITAARQPADKGQDSHEAPGQHLEQMLVERVAHRDRKPGFLAHLAFERGAMILARIGPPARQIPFVALVQEQEDTVPMDQDAL